MRAEGAGGIVDQDEVGLDRRKAGADAVGALGAADDQFADVAVAKRQASQLFLACADHDADRIDRRV